MFMIAAHLSGFASIPLSVQQESEKLSCSHTKYTLVWIELQTVFVDGVKELR